MSMENIVENEMEMENETVTVYYDNRKEEEITEEEYDQQVADGEIAHVDDEPWRVSSLVFLEDRQEYTPRYLWDYSRCDCCGLTYSDDYVVTDDYDNCICNDCRDGYVFCENCDRLIPLDDSYEHNGYYYCEDCYEKEEGDLVEDYRNDQFDPRYDKSVFHSQPYEDTVEFFGVELEVEEGSRGDWEDAARDIKNRISSAIVNLKHDGSLDDGFEIVSCPGTLRYHKESYPWQEILDICLDNRMISHDSSNCGLHIHVSREAFGEDETLQCLHIAILMMLQQRFATKFHTFSRRDAGRYCRDNQVDIDKHDNFQTVKKKYDKQSRDRYFQINIQNEHTVEFRCFRGTLKYETLIASLEFVATLVRYCTQITIADVESVEWEDIFENTEYETLKTYMKSRGLL